LIDQKYCSQNDPEYANYSIDTERCFHFRHFKNLGANALY
jgi:hypothetical protein